MDRNGAFAEYARILKEAEDWLADGYRRGEEETAFVPPSRNAAGGGASGMDSPEKPPKLPLSSSAPRHPAFKAPDRVEPGTGNAAALSDIAGDIRTCESCNLYLIRKNTVPGRGAAGARLMVVTPPPIEGAGEDSTPLSVHENTYLGKWLTALGLNLERDVFITPAVKCHTPGGRPPHTEEAASCAGYLRRQYEAVAPRAVLALGDGACGALSGDIRDFPILVGKDWTWGAVPALILWTPAEVLAHPARLRRPVWEALQRFKAAWDALPGTGF